MPTYERERAARVGISAGCCVGMEGAEAEREVEEVEEGADCGGGVTLAERAY